MDQMPVPIATAPPSSQTARVQPTAAVTRPAMSKATYDANMAINTESATSASLYESIKSTAAMLLHPIARLPYGLIVRRRSAESRYLMVLLLNGTNLESRKR